MIQVLICVDSKSVLNSLKSFNMRERGELVTEITHVIHFLSTRGTSVNFCWVPSHCGFPANEWADRTAKKGAQSKNNAIKIEIPLSLHEGYCLLEKACWNQLDLLLQNCYYPRKNTKFKACSSTDRHNDRVFSSLIYRLRLDALKTKFSRNVSCVCGDQI